MQNTNTLLELISEKDQKLLSDIPTDYLSEKKLLNSLKPEMKNQIKKLF